MSSNSWIESIKVIEPKINELIQAMQEGSKIKPVLSPTTSDSYTITLEEEWPSVDDAGNYFNSSDLDNRVKWATIELDKWDHVSRRAWDKWQFKSRRDAEKFITLYNLVWG
jgi:hypothetical protein